MAATPSRIHFLHLTEESLSWATLTGWPRGPRLESRGVIEAEAPHSLDRFMKTQGDPSARFVLYDGRPMYFSFVTRLPKKAKKQLEGAVKLKIRQELGLGEDEVYWSARPEPSKEARDRLDVFTVVTRRESLEDIVRWKQRHSIRALWVGADLSAVRSLLGHRMLPSPVLLANASERGATLYYARGRDSILKGRVAQDAGADEGYLPDLGWDSSTPAALFGGEAAERLARAHPALKSLPSAPELDFSRNGLGRRFDPSLLAELSAFDAVILGAVAEHGGRPAAAGSFLPLAEQDARAVRAVPRLRLAWLIPAALFAAIVLAVSVGSVRERREQARLKLVARANSLTASVQRYRSQEAVLRRIKADRAPTIPIFEAIHKAAPSGMTLQSLDLSQTGVVQITGSTKNAEAPTTFFKALSESDLFERVQLPEVKLDREKKGVSFQLTAKVKSRAGPRRRGVR